MNDSKQTLDEELKELLSNYSGSEIAKIQEIVSQVESYEAEYHGPVNVIATEEVR